MNLLLEHRAFAALGQQPEAAETVEQAPDLATILTSIAAGLGRAANIIDQLVEIEAKKFEQGGAPQ